MLVALVLHGCLAAEQHTCGTTAVPGILGTHGLAACCPASCGECGGKGCQSRPGGKEACCAGAIRSSARTCDRHAPPCLPWPAAHHETWQPAPGFVGLPHAPGASRVESRKGKRRFGPVLGCASFETPNCALEWDEWNLVRALVRPRDTVLEFGARFGTTSCVLAEATGNSGRVISVEPDARAHATLLSNLRRNRCNVGVVLGTVGEAAQALRGTARYYGRYDQSTRDARVGEASLPRLGLHDIESAVGANVSVALVDCEGCLPSVMHILKRPSVRALILEEDAAPTSYLLLPTSYLLPPTSYLRPPPSYTN